MGGMSRHYRHCRECHVSRDLVPLSKRGLCGRCAFRRGMTNLSAMIGSVVAVSHIKAGDAKLPAGLSEQEGED